MLRLFIGYCFMGVFFNIMMILFKEELKNKYLKTRKIFNILFFPTKILVPVVDWICYYVELGIKKIVDYFYYKK